MEFFFRKVRPVLVVYVCVCVSVSHLQQGVGGVLLQEGAAGSSSVCVCVCVCPSLTCSRV